MPERTNTRWSSSATRTSPPPSSSRSRSAWASWSCHRHQPAQGPRSFGCRRFADVSNLDKDNKPFARDDRRRLFAIGNRLWHSDSSFKVMPAKYSLLTASPFRRRAATPNLRICGRPTSAREETKQLLEELVCEHSQIYSRQQAGFTDFTDEERERFKPVLQTLIRTHPSTGRKSLYLSSHAGKIIGWPVPKARPADRPERARDAARVRLFAQMAGRRSGHVGQPPDDAPRPSVSGPEPRDVRRTTLKGEGPTVAQQAA